MHLYLLYRVAAFFSSANVISTALPSTPTSQDPPCGELCPRYAAGPYPGPPRRGYGVTPLINAHRDRALPLIAVARRRLPRTLARLSTAHSTRSWVCVGSCKVTRREKVPIAGASQYANGTLEM